MSSIHDIMAKASALVDSLKALLQSQTAQALPDVAKQLGIETRFNEGVHALTTALESIDVELGKLSEDIGQLEAVRGLVGLLEPLVGALARMLGEASHELADYGLSAAVAVSGGVHKGFTYVARAQQVAGGLVIESADFEELRDSMFLLAQRVHCLATDIPDDAVLVRAGATT